ncbi:MAG: PilN domain-containing protein [Planctomycetota bacterium]|jgi:cell division protein FtsB
MKEIDFIPEWYKASQTRRKRYHRQYMILATMLVLMMGWSFVVGRHVENVKADVGEIQSVVETRRAMVNEGTELEAEILQLKQQADILKMAESRTDVSMVIAELSALVGDNIILSRLSLKDEVIKEPKKSAVSTTTVQIGAAVQKKDGLLKQMRKCVTLTGIAAAPADAARLISQLEQSPYFRQETLVYSKPKTVKKHNVTEFEIRCYVADYKTRK